MLPTLSSRVRAGRCAPRAARISVLFCGTDGMSLPTLRALAGALRPALPRASPEVTALGVLCPGPRPMGRGQSPSALPVAAFAAAAGLPCLEVPYGVRSLAAPPFADALAAFLAPARFDLGVVVSFGYLLPTQPLLAALPLGAINLHPSALPRHRGAAPVPHTLLAGEAHTAVSVIEVHPTRMDAGGVLLQERVAIGPGVGAVELTALLAQRGAEAMLRTVLDLPAARARVVAQEEALATRAPKLKPEHGRVLWATATPALLLRMARAFQGTIGVHCHVGAAAAGEGAGAGAGAGIPPPRIKLLELAQVDAGAAAALQAGAGQGLAPGALVFEGRSRRLYAACAPEREGEGVGSGSWVELVRVQLEGKTAVSGAAYAMGRHARGVGVTVLDVALR